ncbi:hypothetical protein [Salinicoccus carnicancri]|uniref:hypothetical protein n=1 Tax=Salinicoccus carnicancri TaxID=558170 RepID=UPI0003045FA9|nr:hypothetical protein [Salinicoccus carnicancri]
MISYRTLNEYLGDIELPLTIEEILDYEHGLDGSDFEFVDSAGRFLKAYGSYNTYRHQNAHCIGTCLTNLTRVGIYFLLDKELVTVSTSNLRPVDEDSEWEITHYPFREMTELDMQRIGYTNEADHEAGTLYIKLLDDKGNERTYVLRNLNPEHFQCFRDFHQRSIDEKHV